jgi:Zn-dependent protease with chaperone function
MPLARDDRNGMWTRKNPFAIVPDEEGIPAEGKMGGSMKIRHASACRFWLALMAVAGVSVSCAPVSQLPTVDKALAEVEEQKQKELVVKQIHEDFARLHRVTYPILLANADVCRERTALGIGVLGINKLVFPKDFQVAAAKAFDMADAVRVIAVAPGTKAEAAGFKVGDAIAAIDDWSFPIGKEAYTTETQTKFQEVLKNKKTVKVVVSRAGSTMDIVVEPETICAYGYTVIRDEEINATADGKNIRFTNAMMRFAANDTELATVVGHEIAHNLMSHIDKKQGNAAAGFLVDLLFAGIGVNTQGAFSNMAAQAYSQEFEAEADYVGLYLTARAGFKIDDAPNLWRRMGVQHPGSILTHQAASHPATPARFVALEKTVKEIQEKQAAGKPLIPERKAEETMAVKPAYEAGRD